MRRILLAALLLAGCAAPPTTSPAAPTATPTPASLTPAAQVLASATAAPGSTATPSPLPPPGPAFHFCEPAYEVVTGHFVLAAPIGPEHNQMIDPAYRYGSTANGRFDVHHGVEFVNRPGTPVLAAADGVVVFAGTDDAAEIAFWPRFYGNVVVLEHALAGQPAPIYTLYGHLSTIAVTVGESVAAGQEIGQVGATGVALGNHLHFEVRAGENEYAATRNPELWLMPPAGTGALAAYVLDANGQPIPGLPLVITPLDEGNTGRVFLEAYGAGANGDDGWGEQYAASGLPAGRYQVALTYGRTYRTEVEVQAGQLMLVPFCISP